MDASTLQATGYGLRFSSLFHSGRGFVFPCDAHGKIALAALSAPQRESYLRARLMVGSELATPVVVRTAAAMADPEAPG
ncbi:hypothetical protein [Piscinibacter sp.]|uniref:hypothetical protein n=1 Tax=Piscinibacter sp. TaxID=1903157 RepID=UPI002C0FCACE|nr:hypothetical protein [Albitalea sp.]HUG26203.1 hypothetical protein [Albitalea sp.]